MSARTEATIKIDMSVCLHHPFYREQSTVSAILRTMDENEIDRAVLFPYAAAVNYEFRSGNEELSKVLKAHPDRFVGFGVFNPFKDLNEVDRMKEDFGFRGVKFLTGWGEWIFGFNHYDRFVIPFAEKVAEHGLIMSIEHESRVPLHAHVAHDAYIADAVPDLRIILSRCWSWHMWRDYIAIAEAYPSFLIEFGLAPSSLVRQAIETLGVDRFLLGSWMPEVSQKQALAVLSSLDLTESEVRAIQGGNAVHLLDMGNS